MQSPSTGACPARLRPLIRREGADLSLDLHEAVPIYGIRIGNEPSPVKLRGLSHRELGDQTATLSLLAETGNPIQDPSRGRTSEALILEGKDEFLLRAGQKGLLFIPYDEHGLPVDERVGRHLATVMEILRTYSELFPDRPIEVDRVPSYEQVVEHGVGHFLARPGS